MLLDFMWGRLLEGQGKKRQSSAASVNDAVSVRRPRPSNSASGGSEEISGAGLETLRVWLLGGFRVEAGTRTVDRQSWRLRKAKSLIKLLALAPDHRMHCEQLAELLWPDSKPKAQAASLRQTLYVVRRALGGKAGGASRYLCLEDGLLMLCPEGPIHVDVEAFELAAARARHTGDPAAYTAAIDLYAGDLLPEDRYEPWAEDRREHLRRTYLDLLVELAAIYEEREDYGAAIEALSLAVETEPADEDFRACLMRLYAASGNRREALKQFRLLRESLNDELGVEPSVEVRRLYEEIEAGRSPSMRRMPKHPQGGTPDPGRHNLPAALDTFIGRERELVEVQRQLAMTRLLTLTGAGGCGKTRLALEVARALVGAYPDGVRLVELAPLSEPELLPQAVAGTLSIREQPGRAVTDTLVDALASRELLLVLDNCEHLVEEAARLTKVLLSSCPRLRILATSRELLEVAGEVSHIVPSLSLPEPTTPAIIGEVLESESVRLFVDRARSRQSAFELSEENAEAVGEICRRLDGVPLAVVLVCGAK